MEANWTPDEQAALETLMIAGIPSIPTIETFVAETHKSGRRVRSHKGVAKVRAKMTAAWAVICHFQLKVSTQALVRIGEWTT